MRLRRPALALAALSLVATLPRASRSAPGRVDVDVDGYAGRTTGGWACGPTAHTTYGGGAAQVRYADAHAGTREGGVAAVVGGSVARETNQRIDPSGGCAPADTRGVCGDVPAPRAMAAVHGRADWSDERWGVGVGVGSAQWWSNHDDARPYWHTWPAFDARIGRVSPGRTSAHVGLGTTVPTMAARPGLYGGAVHTPDDDLGWEAWGSLTRCGPSFDLCARADGAFTFPLSPTLRLRAGLSLDWVDVSRADLRVQALDPAGSVGLGARF